MNQKELELKTLKNQLIPRLREEAREILKMFKIKGVPNSLSISIVAYLLLYKQLDPATIAGLMFKEVKGDMLLLEKALYRLTSEDVIDFNGSKFITKYVLDPQTQLEVDAYCYPLPMVEKPNKVKGNSDSAYYTIKKDSLILRDNYTDEDINLEYINHQNNIELELSQYSINNNKNVWDIKSEITKQNFERFNKAQKEIIKEYKSCKFFLTWKYDKRGRSYDQGFHIHLQGNDFSKSLIEFSKKEIPSS